MTTLFEPISINGITLRNRIIRSATWEGMCQQDGRPTEKLIAWYEDLARGGVGLIVSGYTFVRPDGKQLPGKMGIHTDDFADDFRNMTQRVHQAGGSIAIQLVHAGGQTSTTVAGRQPLAPSAVQPAQFPEMPAEMTATDIRDLIQAFAQAAFRAQAWGFDAVQLHGAHGYLINQFLSPLTNQRTDGYGGSPEDRCRFLLEVYQAVRDSVGQNFPVTIKLSGCDHQEGGLTEADALEAARRLDEAGIDAIEVSSGTAVSGDLGPIRTPKTPEQEAYNLQLAQTIRASVACPVFAVGGFRSFEIAERAVRDDGIDGIALSRPLIREPGLPNRWQGGDHAPATCISCNRCFVPGMKEGGIYCVIDKE